MTLDLRPLAQDLAHRAEDLLQPVPDRAGARRLLLEELEIEYPALGQAEHGQIVDWTMVLLEEDDFFGVTYVGDAFAGPDGTEETD